MFATDREAAFAVNTGMSLETYLYRVKIDGTPIEIGEGSIDGTYVDVKEIYVEPCTGRS